MDEVPAWLPRAAAAHPDRPAVESPEGVLTYAELHEQAERWASSLAVEGARPGRPVALDLPAGAPFAAALHGCLLLGAPATPIDDRLSGAERAPRIARCAVVARDPPASVSPASDTSGGGHRLADVALELFTSGTTAAPRPVALTYGNLLWSALGSALALGLDPGERWLCPMPLSHVGGLSILVRSAIYATTVVLRPRFDVRDILRALREEGTTLVSLVPTMLARLLDAGLERPPALRWALLGGGPIPEPLLLRARAAGVPVLPTYGLTETCSQVVTGGRPLLATRVELAEDGEILVSGATVAPGALGTDGRLHTGDLGAWDEDGRLRVVGRKAETIVSGGENVAPAEVEAVLLSHPGLVEAAVYGRPDPEWGERVVAAVVLRPGASPSVAELREWCAERLARFKAPREIRFVTELPRTGSGKVMRRALAETLEAGAHGRAASVAPMDAGAHRAAQRERWERSAVGWSARREDVQRFALPVSRRLIDAARPHPGFRVLELAAGTGETGFLASELIAPGGTLVCSDGAQTMLDGARARARELGLENVEFKLIDLEWIDEPTASFDAVLCRWGYMFAVDPEAALRETRRVLRSGGRLALAAWDEPRHNPWATAAGAELQARGLTEPPEEGAPGMFALSAPGRLADLLHGAGFAEVEVEPLELEHHHESFEAYWAVQRDLSLALGEADDRLEPDAAVELRAGVAARLRPLTGSDGTLRLPARALVASATA